MRHGSAHQVRVAAAPYRANGPQPASTALEGRGGATAGIAFRIAVAAGDIAKSDKFSSAFSIVTG